MSEHVKLSIQVPAQVQQALRAESVIHPSGSVTGIIGEICVAKLNGKKPKTPQNRIAKIPALFETARPSALMHPDLLRRLQAAAAERNMSAASLVADWVRESFEKKK